MNPGRPRRDSSDNVRAAGAILTDDHGRIAVVWRDRHHDWSLPKGKQDPGETDEQTAHREVLEETGYRGEIVADLGSISYRDDRDRAKTVRYFHMTKESGEFTPNDEVSRLEWLDPHAAVQRLTHDLDRELVRSFERGSAGPDA